MSFLILTLVVIAISALLIWLVFKIKSTAARVVLTIVIVLAAIVSLAIGGAIMGAVWFVQEAGTAIEEEGKKEEERQREIQPRLKETGEAKDVFEQTEVVVGNGAEIEILRTYTIEDLKDLEFVENDTYCAVDVRFKNTNTENQIIYSSNFTLKEDDGTTILSPIVTDEDLSAFESFEIELQPGAESTKSIPFDCQGKQEPFTLVYDGGSLLFFSLLSDEEFKPIRFNVSF
jgi:hypothetical protein